MHKRDCSFWLSQLAPLAAVLVGIQTGGCGSDAGSDGNAPGTAGAQADSAGSASRTGVEAGEGAAGSDGSGVGTEAEAGAAGGVLSEVRVTVVDVSGAALPSATVHVAGVTRTTDASGSADFSEVQVPYLALVEAEGNAYALTGLRRADPVVHTVVQSSANVETLTGALDGLSSFTTTPTSRLMSRVAFGSDAGTTQGSAIQEQFSLPTSWLSAAGGVLRAVQYEYDAGGELAGYPTNFLLYGSVPADADARGIAVGMSPIRQEQVTGRLTVPAAAMPYEVCLHLLFEDEANLQFRRLGGTQGAFSYPIPVVDQAQTRLSWGFMYPSQAEAHLLESVLASDEVERTVPLPLVLTAPEDGANEVGPGTVFEVTDTSASVHAVVMYSKATVDGPRIVVYVDGTSAELPDLSPLSITLPSETSYTWTSWALHGVGSVNELAAAADYAQTGGCAASRATRLRALVSGPWREFVTAAE